MSGQAIVGTVMLILVVVVFTGVVFWAYSSGRKKQFDQAAQAPFALSDDAEGTGSDNSIKQDIDQRGRQP
ncbi:MAG: CcoQ/FixQ family Cbb3-type cytochrome c oxidase assembly chaperone [Burkholderiales bacterium]|nr:CcoQ/FixQ family Cbb3-type cytochrome c oxidase assembly chaperone [Burkholderiales bacterium]